MSNNNISLPPYMLPIVMAAVPALVAWGSMQAQAQATDEDVKRVTKVIEKVVEKADANTKSTALNEQAIKTLADSLSQSNELAAASDAKLQTLIEIMLKQNQ